MSTDPETPGSARMREADLRGQLETINGELAALGLDPEVSTLDQSKFLPRNCVDHAEFDMVVEVWKARITDFAKEESKKRIELEKSTKALKRIREMSPDSLMLEGAHMKHLKGQLENTQRQARGQWTSKRRELMGAKVSLNKHYETCTSMDEDEYHRVLGELLDKKLQVHEDLRGLARSY